MENCVFCRIARGEVPAKKLFENDRVMAFPDQNPQAPQHVLIVPKRHLSSILELDDPALTQALMEAARAVAEKLDLTEEGFRLLTNVGRDGGQTVPHLHWHLLGGRRLGWPPG